MYNIFVNNKDSIDLFMWTLNCHYLDIGVKLERNQ